MLSLEGVTKRYGAGRRQVVAVCDVTLDVPEGAFLTLLGPSGCGKTTTLRCIAGLERLDAGRIELAGAVVSDAARGVHVPPEARGLGMVFQSPAVWPHMTVRENVEFPLRAAPRGQRASRAEARQRATEALERVQLAGLDGRPAVGLSGGQQQRLVLARALACRPRLLLLDEPLAALDASLRDAIGAELGRLQRELGTTTVYVTHDQDEALALSTHLAVVLDGRLEQVGTPREVYEHPATARAAMALGATNLLPGSVRGTADGRVVVATEHGPLAVPRNGACPPEGSRVLVVVRPDHVLLHPGGDGIVTHAAFRRDAADLLVRCGPSELRVRVGLESAPAAGERVAVSFAEARLALVPEADGAR